MRKRLTWTIKQLGRLNNVIEVLKELDAYKPLTLRQIYYQLVGKGYIENKTSQYSMLSNLLKWARIDGYIPWEDIEDRGRVHHNLRGWYNSADYLKKTLGGYLRYYRRDLWKGQDKYVEVWIEKDALSSIFTRVCSTYGVSVIVCRGFSSVSFLHDFSKRVMDTAVARDPVMLYFGDFDPSGIEMLESMKTTLTDELNLNIYGIEFKRIALALEDVSRYNLPHDPKALKRTDTRAEKHLERYGEVAVELDALRPDVLEEKIRIAIEEQISDKRAFREQQEKGLRELESLEDLRDDILMKFGVI